MFTDSLMSRICATRGCVRSPEWRRSTPLDIHKRLIGLLERALNQVSGGFKGMGGANQTPIRHVEKNKTRWIPTGFMRFWVLNSS